MHDGLSFSLFASGGLPDRVLGGQMGEGGGLFLYLSSIGEQPSGLVEDRGR